MTMVPRTGPLSASSARATTSWYQRGKSEALGVSPPFDAGDRSASGALVMAGQATGWAAGPWREPSGRPPRSAVRRLPEALPDVGDLDPGGVRVGALLLQQLLAVGGGLGLGRAGGGGEPGLDPLGHQLLGLGHQRLDHLVFGDHPDDLALDEQMALGLARRDPEVGLTRLTGPVHHTAHDRDLDRQVAVLQRF